mmetsp:Transcript_1160/g.2749  ORF Transcript_1160/g.2749 Transcript_1160/m.2749 type:complete len:346 (-) Transcript_1160:133-1170(-)
MKRQQEEGAQRQHEDLPDNQRSRRTACFSTSSLAVPIVLALYIGLYCVDVFVVIVPWLSFSVPGMTNLLVLTTSVGLAVWCYGFCVVVDPGRVPNDWTPDAEANDNVEEVKRKGGTPRFCQKCVRPKPPRAHHCRVCKRCVLRMDHHCPWTGNCVGHANHKAYLLCLFYTSLALIHTLGLLVTHAIHTIQTSQQQRVVRVGPHGQPVDLEGGEGGDAMRQNVWFWAMIQTLAFAVALPLTVALLMLLLWHIQLSLTNKTSIEFQEGVTALVKGGGMGGRTRRHIYDLGPCANIHAILGENAGSWLAPPCSSMPGGFKYPKAADDPATMGLYDPHSWDAWLGASRI